MQLDIEDVSEALAIVAAAVSPDDSQLVPDRKRALAKRLATLIDADVYIWNACSVGENGDIMATSVIDGGWPSQEQRKAVFEILTRTDFNQNIAGSVIPVMQSQKPRLLPKYEVINEVLRRDLDIRFSEIGLVDVLLYLYPISHASLSGIGLYRFGTKVPFTARDYALIELVMNHVDWLHRDGIREDAALESLELSPRERQVLLELLKGDAKSGIAISLDLSPHTIEDYIKAIYRKLNVNTRPELHALFHLGRMNRN